MAQANFSLVVAETTAKQAQPRVTRHDSNRNVEHSAHAAAGGVHGGRHVLAGREAEAGRPRASAAHMARVAGSGADAAGFSA